MLAGSSAARADDDGYLHPASVRASLDGEMAHITARFLVAKEGPGSHVAMILLPEGALVTSASVDAHRLALLPADAAETAFRDIEEAPIARDPRWAAKITAAGRGSVAVAIASPQGGFAELVLEIAAPSCYFADARYVPIPQAWQRALALSVRVAAPPIGCGESEHWLAIHARELLGKPAGLDRIGGTAGRLALDDLHIARLELDIASKLGEVPRDLATVILLDSSRSLDDARVIEQRKLVLAYARRVPDTRLQIVTYARTPHALLPGWTTASQVLPRLERMLAAEPLRNGSNLDDALAAAAGWLAQLPGTHRILIITDELLPPRIIPTSLRAVLDPDTLVHVAVLDGAGPLAREDDGPLGPLAAATYGMRVHGEAGDPELLVRPISIDHLRVRAPGWTDMARAETSCTFDDAQLAEGRSCTWWVAGDASAGPLTIEGMAWGRRLARGFAADLGRGEALARALAGRGGLDEPYQALADRAAHAVDSVWSMFGAWGGHGGYGGEDLGLGMVGGGSSCGCDGFGTLGHGSHIGTARVDDHLEAQLAPAIAACGAQLDRVSVTLELTLAETVDVAIDVQSTLENEPSVLRRRRACLVESIWEIELAIAIPQEHQTVTVALGK